MRKSEIKKCKYVLLNNLDGFMLRVIKFRVNEVILKAILITWSLRKIIKYV